MRFLQRALAGTVLTAMSIALLGWALVTFVENLPDPNDDRRSGRSGEETAQTVRALTVMSETYSPVISVPGELRARRSLELRSRAAGLIVWVAPEVEEGGQVSAGQLLVRTDPAAAKAELARAEADLREAEQELRDAGRSVELAALDLAASERQAVLQQAARDRQRDLQERGVGSASAFETAELAAASADQAVVSRQLAAAQASTRLDQADAKLARAEVALSEARRALADTEIHAAFTGTLAEVTVIDGGYVAANERLAVLVDPADLEVDFRVSTVQYSRLLTSEGRLHAASVRVTLESGGLILESGAELDRAAALVGDGETGRLLFARLESDAGFRAGDLVRVEITEPPLERVALLPARAVTPQSTVMAIGDEDRLQSLPVTILRRQADNILVQADEIAGARVVAAVTPLTGPGLKVNAVDLGAPAEPEAVAAMLRLAPERRAKLIAFIESSSAMTPDAKERVLAQLSADEVPARVVARIESRMGS